MKVTIKTLQQTQFAVQLEVDETVSVPLFAKLCLGVGIERKN